MKAAIVKFSALTNWDPSRYLKADPDDKVAEAEKKTARYEKLLKKAKSERALARRSKRKTQRELDKAVEAGDITYLGGPDGEDATL